MSRGAVGTMEILRLFLCQVDSKNWPGWIPVGNPPRQDRDLASTWLV